MKFYAERPAQVLTGAIGLMILIRGIAAATTPLAADEAYYWLWSKHLAFGYLDHPPLIAFIIRAGTAVFGDTSLGVRIVPWLLSLVATVAVWRTGVILLKNAYAAGLAAFIFNLMPMVGIEALVATPDAPEIAAAAVLLWILTEIGAGAGGPWWIAAGIAAGFALLSKYTGFFLGAGILLWLVADARQRHWFASPWPYLGGAIALLLFAPVVLWNAQHDWVSFQMQFGRVSAGGLTWRYLLELLGAQVGLASPFIFGFGIWALYRSMRDRDGSWPDLKLIVFLMAPAVIYFLVHALHDRVQGNWPSFLYSAFAIAVAAGLQILARREHLTRTVRISRLLAAPLAGVMTVAVYAQAMFGIVPVVREPVSRLIAAGIEPVVMDLEVLKSQAGASVIVTTSYAVTGWLSFYLPRGTPVIQLNERTRWINEPPPNRELLSGPLLYVTERRNDQMAELRKTFADVVPLAHIARYRKGAVFDEYAVYRLDGLRGEPFF
ncbi:MAG TPA: glycosyltransferase family 39 protein [Micropepsaceae bacterium]|nr:glycosyltransferase family 39 protein [Micropepsaceae bacterium]